MIGWTGRPMSVKKPFNLSLEYSYRLSVAVKVTCQIVLAGPASSNDVAAIKDRLEDGLYFVPGQVLLPDLRCAFDERQRTWDKKVDHPWHELDKVNLTRISPTDWFDQTAFEVVEAFLAVRWDDDYLSGPLKPLFLSNEMVPRSEAGKLES